MYQKAIIILTRFKGMYTSIFSRTGGLSVLRNFSLTGDDCKPNFSSSFLLIVAESQP
jgi:hypothetical protein